MGPGKDDDTVRCQKHSARMRSYLRNTASAVHCVPKSAQKVHQKLVVTHSNRPEHCITIELSLLTYKATP